MGTPEYLTQQSFVQCVNYSTISEFIQVGRVVKYPLIPLLAINLVTLQNSLKMTAMQSGHENKTAASYLAFRGMFKKGKTKMQQ